MAISEESSPAAHHFMTLARFLMCVHPTKGATSIAIHLGLFLPYRLGWNFDGERYVWIGAEWQDGRTTHERPAGIPDSEIHRAPPEPDFFTGQAPRLLIRALTALERQLAEKEGRTQIHQIYHQVLEAARVEPNLKEAWDPQIAESMLKSLHEGLSMPQLSILSMISPTKYVMDPYLELAIPGGVARRVLASYLVYLVDSFPPPVAFEGHRVERLMSLFMHLRNGVGVLLAKRAECNLPSFYLLTYLAVLLGDTALIVGRTLINQVPLSSEQRTNVIRNQRMLDEEVTHLLYPTFLYPALYCNRSVLEVALQTARPARPATDFVYPQLAGTNATRDDPENVFRILLEKTAPLPACDVLPLLYGEGTLLMDEQNLIELMKFVLTLSIGRELTGNSAHDPQT